MSNASVNPLTVAYPILLFMEFSRQEYWNGLPFSPPGDLLNPGLEHTSPASPALQVDSFPLSHQGSPYIASVQFSSVAQSCQTLCDPMGCSLPGSSVHGILQARILEWVAISSSSGLFNPGIEPRSLALQTDSLLSEPLGKPIFLPCK